MLSVAEFIALPSLWNLPALMVLSWLTWRFGGTLRKGRIPLIEKIARVSIPELPADICRYSRRLTQIWSLYFLLAFASFFIPSLMVPIHGVLIGMSSITVFLFEYGIRPFLFPEASFPDLRTQIRDTWLVWNQRPYHQALTIRN